MKLLGVCESFFYGVVMFILQILPVLSYAQICWQMEFQKYRATGIMSPVAYELMCKMYGDRK